MADRNTGSNKTGRKNQVKAARNASSRPTGFYIVLSALALAGIGVLAYVVTRPKAAPEAASISSDTAKAGPAQGYTTGNANAPVKIIEFGDFECPQCARFVTLTEPDMRKRLIETGVVSFTYFDFPITNLHRNTQAASNAAACADEQGKFWQMHDRLFDGQDQWNGEATSSPGDVFRSYATEIGLNVDAWQKCFDAQKYQSRVAGNFAEGVRRNINATPSFIIGDSLYTGALPYDQLKSIVDSVRARAARASPPTASTPKK